MKNICVSLQLAKNSSGYVDIGQFYKEVVKFVHAWIMPGNAQLSLYLQQRSSTLKLADFRKILIVTEIMDQSKIVASIAQHNLDMGHLLQSAQMACHRLLWK